MQTLSGFCPCPVPRQPYGELPLGALSWPTAGSPRRARRNVRDAWSRPRQHWDEPQWPVAQPRRKGRASGSLGAMSRSLFDELGGEPALRAIVNRFIDRVFDDVMIGFFFRSANRDRIKSKEYEFAARHLGANIEYTGRPIDAAHARHAIMGGQFMRRLKILEDTLEEFAVPDHIRNHWIEHTLSLQPLVTRDSGGKCDPDAALERVKAGRVP